MDKDNRIFKGKKSETFPKKIKNQETQNENDKLFKDIANMIEKSRYKIARKINGEMVLLYWNIGRKIKQYILNDRKPEYGNQVVTNLSEKLKTYYGKGFSTRNLFHMLQFVEVFPNDKILQTLSAKLSWSHFIEIMYIKEDIKRNFYMEMCSYEGWSVRLLKNRINSMLFERTAISKKPEKLIEKELEALRNKEKLSTELVFRDPYFLAFLELEDTYSEKDLENAILAKLSSFLIEFGSDFAFIGRQKRITIDNKDYYIDLLFYHRGLRALVVIELKLGEFQPEPDTAKYFYCNS